MNRRVCQWRNADAVQNLAQMLLGRHILQVLAGKNGLPVIVAIRLSGGTVHPSTTTKLAIMKLVQ